jgi:hypothetical protein
MANAYKVLGQTADASTEINLVGDQDGETIVSTVVICNRSAAEKTYDLRVVPSGETAGDEHYISKAVPVPANDTLFLTLGITLADGDVIKATASTSDVSFSAFGTVITA